MALLLVVLAQVFEERRLHGKRLLLRFDQTKEDRDRGNFNREEYLRPLNVMQEDWTLSTASVSAPSPTTIGTRRACSTSALTRVVSSGID